MVDHERWNGLIRELEAAELISDGHFAYRSGMHSLRLVDRDQLLSDTHLASRLGYALAKQYFLTRSDVVATPSIWGSGLAQWVGYFLEPRRPVVFGYWEQGKYLFSPDASFLEGRRVLVIDNLILTGSTIQEFVQAITAAGGRTVGIGALANLSNREFPIAVTGLLDDELCIFDPKKNPQLGADLPVTQVGF